MKVVGYTDKLSVQQGESIRVMVSCELPNYSAILTRLIHGDDNPHGPGFKEELLDSPANGDYPGRKQQLHNGSYVMVQGGSKLDVRSFTLQAWIYPTTPMKGAQGIITKWSGNSGYGLFISDRGELSLRVGDGTGDLDAINSGVPLIGPSWYFVAGSYDAEQGRLTIHQESLAIAAPENWNVSLQKTTHVKNARSAGFPFLIGAYAETRNPQGALVGGHFNGKVEGPKIFDRPLTTEELDSLKGGETMPGINEALLGAWDFSIGISSSKVTDISKEGLHGTTVNMPTRGVTGHNWTGKEVNFRVSPQGYAAIHFHDDDLDDARWDVDFEFRVPENLRSGVYAFRLRAGDAEDYVAFFVRPKRGTTTARIAFLVPTLSYLAYADEHTMTLSDIANSVREGVRQNYPVAPQDKYVIEHRLLSLYDRHSDGSGVCYSSKLRPLVSLRPKYNSPFLPGARGGPHQFNADMHVVDWLTAKGHSFDVITDEDLHHDGLPLLAQYRVIITGSHPEYWTEAMLRALIQYLNGGGRMMYLGGNGFYWVTSIDQERSHAIEIRRWGGSGTWRTAPGENYHSTTGEIGGIWRNRGLAPNKIVGVGWAGQGLDRCLPYVRTPESLDPRVAFIFEGVGRDELIGDFESLDMVWGAAGFEIDRLDHALGSPRHTILLATGTGFSHAYQRTVDEVLLADSKQGGPDDPKVRADMVYLDYPRGGAVFSVGSIGWCGCLSFNRHDNNVSRITDNVLKDFVSR